MSKTAYSIDEAAEETGLGRTTIREHIAKGNLIAKYPNSKPIIRQIDLDDWLDSLPTESPKA